MRYCITMEQTRRIAVYFDIPNDEDAEEKAAQISRDTPSDEFSSGDEERDYALVNMDTQKTLLDWD